MLCFAFRSPIFNTTLGATDISSTKELQDIWTPFALSNVVTALQPTSLKGKSSAQNEGPTHTPSRISLYSRGATLVLDLQYRDHRS